MLKKLTHIILAIIVLFSSTGFVVSKHLCQKELKGISLFGKAKNCHEAHKTCPRHKTPPPGDEKKDCCENEFEYHKLDQDQQTQTFNFKLVNPMFLIATVMVFFDSNLFEPQTNSTQFLTYRPPIVPTDIVVSYQRFLC